MEALKFWFIINQQSEDDKMASRAKILPVNENVIPIDDAGELPCYFVTGENRALLIDTAIGLENSRMSSAD